MFGRKKTGKGRTLSKEEEERLLGRITEEPELKVDPVFGSSLQKRKIRERLDKLSKKKLQKLAEDRNQGSAKDKQRNLDIMVDYFYNAPQEWEEWRTTNLGMTKEEQREEKKKRIRRKRTIQITRERRKQKKIRRT